MQNYCFGVEDSPFSYGPPNGNDYGYVEAGRSNIYRISYKE